MAERFPSFTVIPATGYWQGQRESSLAIEVETEDHARIVEAAQCIRVLNTQQAVLVQRLETKGELIQ